MSEFLMPSLGADMDAGTLLEWRIKPGDSVKRGDIVALVDTDKAAIEIEVFEAGKIEKLLIPEGEKVPVGTPLALISPPGEKQAPAELKPTKEEPILEVAPKAVVERPRATPAARKHELELGLELSDIQGTGKHGVITKEDVEHAAASVSVAVKEKEPQIKASPLARRLAKELGIELAAVQGSGPDGAITRADIERAAAVPEKAVKAPPTAKKPAIPKTATADKQAAMRRAIAAAMAKSKREIPHYYLSTHIDMSKALAFLEEENLQRPLPDRLLPAVLLLKASALAIRKVPEMNGFWLDDGFKPSDDIHLGVGISLRGGGLIAPAIHNADKKDLGSLMTDLRDLVARSRSGGLRSSEMTDATITVTNMGDQGIETVYGVIYPPQVALLGFGKITERPWAEAGMVGARPVVHLTLAADHRASDGHRGGLFLAAIERLLQKPEEL